MKIKSQITYHRSNTTRRPTVVGTIQVLIFSSNSWLFVQPISIWATGRSYWWALNESHGSDLFCTWGGSRFFSVLSHVALFACPLDQSVMFGDHLRGSWVSRLYIKQQWGAVWLVIHCQLTPNTVLSSVTSYHRKQGWSITRHTHNDQWLRKCGAFFTVVKFYNCVRNVKKFLHLSWIKRLTGNLYVLGISLKGLISPNIKSRLHQKYPLLPNYWGIELTFATEFIIKYQCTW